MIKEYSPDRIRNVVILGHAGTGKSTLLDALLYTGNMINQIGTHQLGNLTSDFDLEEKKRQMSVHTAMGFIEIDGVKINIIDCPGHADFVGERWAAVQAADAAILVLDSVDGVQVGTEKAWRHLNDKDIPRIIFVNKMDQDRASYDSIIQNMENNLHAHLVSLCLPIGGGESFEGVVDILDMKSIRLKTAGGRDFVTGDIPDSMNDLVKQQRTKLVEIAAEGDDELIEMFLEGADFDEEQIMRGIKKQVAAHKLHPVICGASMRNLGIKNLINTIMRFMPSAMDAGSHMAVEGSKNEPVELPCDTSAPTVAVCWKSYYDQFAGSFSYVRVLSGKITPDSEMLNTTTGQREKIGKVSSCLGKDTVDCAALGAGDIGVLVKLNNTNTTHTLCEPSRSIVSDLIELPHPVFGYAIHAANKKDEDKLAQILAKYADQYPSITYGFNAETRQAVVSSMGQLHLDIILDEIKEKYKLEFVTATPRVAYRETITAKSEAQYKHKKQSGGHGQYAEVYIRMEPLPRKSGFEFTESIVGGSVPKQYIPAVEKGLRESLDEGVIANYPVVDLKVDLYDGSFHQVDSSEMAFKIASNQAFRKAMETAKPVLLEPVMNVRIFVDKKYVGDVMGDITSRRGRVLGMESKDEASEEGITVIRALIPHAEMLRYSNDLKTLTANQATFTMEFETYEPISGKIADKVVEERKKMLAEED